MGWESLLVGNGMSINVSSYFAYDSLYEEACKDFDGSLDKEDVAIFEEFSTTNFEVVLAKLRDGISLADVLGRSQKPYRERFRSVQSALGAAVRRVHLEWTEVPSETLAAIKAELRRYDAIFSTSYDLLIYWSIGYNEDYGNFCDCFWANDRNEFDPDDCDLFPNARPVYYMHGALHLIVEGSGITRKLTKSGQTLLDQFGKPIANDSEARPLLITEASPRDKLQAIEGNDYLAFAYEQLQETDGPLVVFGHALGDQDRHLIDAINANPERPVAISMRRKSKGKLREQQSDIYGKLRVSASDIYFFDAATHPLGSSELTVAADRARFLGRWQKRTKSQA
jgi:uncharacterized protein DUF4917